MHRKRGKSVHDDRFWENLTWSCHFCQDERPDARISVVSRDITPSGRGLPQNTMRENRRYCNDRPACAQQAFTWQDEGNRSKGATGT